MKLIPREYQDFAANAPIEYFQEGGTGNPLVAAPTGVGKSVMIALFLKRVFEMWGHQPLKAMMLTHSKILIEQNLEKLLQLWPTAPVGICSAGLKRQDTKNSIIFGGIGSVANIPLYFGHVDFILVDEAHMISLKDSGQYRQFIADIKTVNPNCVVVGFTATKFRMGQGLLTEGDGALFTDIVCDMTTMDAFNWFIDEGYLCRLRPVVTENEYDTTGVRTQAGEYHQGDLAAAVDKKNLTEAVVAESIRIGKNKKSWIVFASGIKHTINMADELNRQGIKTTYVHSNTKEFKMSDDEVEQRIADYQAGVYQAIVNNGILTTGFDHPALDFIIMTRKTKSVVLWIQMLGRGTRPFYEFGYDLSTKEGRLDAIANSVKPYCLVADFAGNCRELGPINDPQIPKAKGKKEPGDAPVRICGECGTYNHASATHCDHCGVEFPRLLQLNVKAAKEELIKESKPAEPIEVKIFPVKRVEYAPHMKAGRPPSIRVTYITGQTRRTLEWICLEHGGAISSRAKNWWRQRCDIPPPDSTVDALMVIHELREPTHIHVRVDNGRSDIINYDFAKPLVETE